MNFNTLVFKIFLKNNLTKCFYINKYIHIHIHTEKEDMSIADINNICSWEKVRNRERQRKCYLVFYRFFVKVLVEIRLDDDIYNN